MSSPLPTPVASTFERPAARLAADVPNQPLVSILIPTHNRPDYAELALRSALSQTYQHIEVIISDNSDDEATRERFAPYIAADERIGYYRVPGASQMDNGLNCYLRARGSYINYLMDDDLLHPDKVAAMLPYLEGMPNIGMVTSPRQLIDANGAHIVAPPAHFAPLCTVETVIGGRSLGARLLSGDNVIGEPTTVLFRRAAAGAAFGIYCDKQFTVLSDAGNWLNILSSHDCVYLPQTLSYFRIHGGQDQRQNWTQIKGHLESLDLFCTAFRQGYFLERDQANRDTLQHKMMEAVMLFNKAAEKIRNANPDLENVLGLMRYATETLLQA